MTIINVTNKNFEAEVLKSDKPVLVDFWAPWCGPCRAIAPVLEKFAAENEGKIKVVKINVDEAPGIAATFEVTSIPTLYVVRDQFAVAHKVGAVSKKELEKFVEKALQILTQDHINKQKPSDNSPKA